MRLRLALLPPKVQLFVLHASSVHVRQLMFRMSQSNLAVLLVSGVLELALLHMPTLET